ncbi:cyclin dependent kinase inhibitor 1Ca [Conger conger]|uniref:cyclin dependent kinase inhibitor 1Ca n=1 Tax=Conger conger TaxID=82655 RepID=UPI002A598E2D|nr:cyclin dependent kinase inhibitor 1Ca [Conger conger]
MSNVQLSSSTQERLAARRTFPLHARTGACRNLFGPVDHEELNREMKSQLREISERDQRRWNFNFEADSPLSGDYEWEETPVDSTPVFYQDSVQTGRRRVTMSMPVNVKPCSDMTSTDCSTQDVQTPRPAEERLSSPEATLPRSGEVNQENCSVKLNSGKQSRKTTVCARRKRTSTTSLTTTTTTHITDFYMKRKRVPEGKQSENSTQNSTPAIPVEQTPRKRIR